MRLILRRKDLDEIFIATSTTFVPYDASLVSERIGSKNHPRGFDHSVHEYNDNFNKILMYKRSLYLYSERYQVYDMLQQ